MSRCPHCYQPVASEPGYNECPSCHLLFNANDDAVSVATAPARPGMQPATKAVLMVLGFVAVVLVAVMAKFMLPESGTGRAAERAAKGDPYQPDCRIIRDYLRANYGEVQVVSWGRRTIMQNAVLGGHSSLSARWRIDGSSRTKHGLFIIGPYETVETATITD